MVHVRRDDAGEWGIAAFTGRSPLAAQDLQSQDCLYSLVVRSAESDDIAVVGSISEAVDGSRVDRLIDTVAAPATAVVTLTITEAGYALDPDGRPDLGNAAVVGDLAWLRRNLGCRATSTSHDAPRTALARLLAAVEARRRCGASDLAIVSCDNLPDNGELTRRGMLGARRTRRRDVDARVPRGARLVRLDFHRPHHAADHAG